ncbi:DNA cytosine methyltransferase [Bacillus norwichensis]|uniref:DNA (cytosine-5-)-methyltransferase n=1 Tax=Bacillus norwichensis TaxID=2762217 RepID=A0ABR8VM56_9BACI|nr:DNA cytosine methyltransferase [Bacillus norwichensis]MBD8005850.1 DNA cytosine methyltransferase [Bacillus norwichensis]
MQMDLFREIIVDNFAGGGGASEGIEMATGLNVDIAINHDPAAIAMHKANHPDTEHYCESVWDIEPKEVVKGRKVGLCWLSPDCRHFSKAKGGKPVSKEVRGLAWVAINWAIRVRPRVIMLENVEEFKTWGPLKINAKGEWVPDPDKKGMTFQSFVKSFKALGYKVATKELRACDYGAPTTRKRLFLIARCDDKPIIWPSPTHGEPDSVNVQLGLKKPYRTAGEVIDWSIPAPSIFTRKRPLAENTMRRIARGIQKFVLNDPKPYIVRIGQTGFGGDRLQYELDRPLTTITTKAEHCLVTPFLSTYYTETTENGVRGQSIKEPVATIPTANRFGLVTAFIAQHFKSSIGHRVDKPLNTITTVNKASLVQAFLLKYYGQGVGQSLNDALHTIPTKDRFGLVTVAGQDYQIVDIGMRMLQPHELFAAQGFPENYIIDRDHQGKKYPKSAQVARCGNAVPPPFAKALVRANLPELCSRKPKVAAGI